MVESAHAAAETAKPVIRSIVVGTDGSATATRAVSEAAELASAAGAKLYLVRAYTHVPEGTFGDGRERAPEEIRWMLGSKQEMERMLAEESESISAAGIEVEVVAVEGDPAEAILGVAENLGADLIVVGNKGMTGARRFLLGSVPNNVSHHAPCSVIIVRTT